MTGLQLQAALCTELKRIFDKITLWNKDEMKIFEYNVPVSTEFEDDEEKYLPYCIVRILGGEVANADAPETLTVDIYMKIVDNSEDRSGHKRMITAITRIRDELEKNAGIPDQFRMIHPIEWALGDDDMYPEINAVLRTRWQIARMPFGAASSRYL